LQCIWHSPPFSDLPPFPLFSFLWSEKTRFFPRCFSGVGLGGGRGFPVFFFWVGLCLVWKQGSGGTVLRGGFFSPFGDRSAIPLAVASSLIQSDFDRDWLRRNRVDVPTPFPPPPQLGFAIPAKKMISPGSSVPTPPTRRQAILSQPP